MITRARSLIEDIVLCLALFLIFRTWIVQGLVEPCRISSGSMAEMLRGPHCEIVCPDCGRHFECGVDEDGALHRAVCPNCGHAEISVEGFRVHPGDRLLLHKSIFHFRRPRRWEIAAFAHPANASQTVVKRVVGLPGETVEIRDGDLWINGHLERKNLEQQRALGVLVYDASHAAKESDALPRWRPILENSAWSESDGQIRFGLGNRDGDWLEYVHSKKSYDPHHPEIECPVTDDQVYNQSIPRRREEVQTVPDIRVAAHVIAADGSGAWSIRLSDGARQFTAVLRPAERRFQVLLDGRPFAEGEGDLPSPLAGRTVEGSLVDRQFLLAVDARTLFNWAVESDRPPRPTSRPVAMAAENLNLVLDDVRIYRDVYYTSPPAPLGRWAVGEPLQLLSGEYFVLGDNSDISEDSRIWSAGPAVPEDLLIGKPLPWAAPSAVLQWGGYSITIPDLRQIRYIH